ncbi:MAG: hypothetical protein ING36_05150 [Burkholderiales bacterium]|jgi:hypothetical protein|nr:hypothetical protein [Burkholderiales bacterium]
MIETLLGTLFGGAFRLAPEILRWLDRKNERAHELAMFDKQLEADKLKGAQALAQINAQADAAIGVAEIQAIIEATKAQSAQTGIKWVDALNASIRPLLALQWLILLWPAVVVAGFVLSVLAGDDPLNSLRSTFGVDEKALAASVASFFLVDRSLRKMFGR